MSKSMTMSSKENLEEIMKRMYCDHSGYNPDTEAMKNMRQVYSGILSKSCADRLSAYQHGLEKEYLAQKVQKSICSMCQTAWYYGFKYPTIASLFAPEKNEDYVVDSDECPFCEGGLFIFDLTMEEIPPWIDTETYTCEDDPSAYFPEPEVDLYWAHYNAFVTSKMFQSPREIEPSYISDDF